MQQQQQQQLSDRERQRDEVFALESILSEREFRCAKRGDKLECLFRISCSICSSNVQDLKLIIADGAPAAADSAHRVRHLPPVRLCVQLPAEYPSSRPPRFKLSVNWLPPWQASLLCQRLDELWLENEGCEILYIWRQFLRDEPAATASLILPQLDLSYLQQLFAEPSDPFLALQLWQRDRRVLYGGLDLDPLQKLLDYDRRERAIEFDESVQSCGICCSRTLGKLFLRLQLCGHAFCKACVALLLRAGIEERSAATAARGFKCPELGCDAEISHAEIREICPPDLFQRYEEALLVATLLADGNLVYCPRKLCGTPVPVEDGESLASCSLCDYNFCAFCLKVYHGVMPCDIDVAEKVELMRKYEEGDKLAKKLLEKRYGRVQIRQLVEKQLTSDYLKENTRKCPGCEAATSKISGCNLMTCSHCSTSFCWLCNARIVTRDKYQHFNGLAGGGSCAGRLFEGIVDHDDDDNDDQADEIDILQNLELAMMYDY